MQSLSRLKCERPVGLEPRGHILELCSSYSPEDWRAILLGLWLGSTRDRSTHTHIFFFLINLFIYFIFGCVGSSLLCTVFSLVAASGGYSSLRCAGFSVWWLLLLQSMGSRLMGFSSCSTQAQ